MRVVDLTNKRFGHLLVLGRTDSRRTYGGNLVTYWRVRCDCGHEKDCSGANLNTGRVKTCSRSTCAYHRAILVRGLNAGDSGMKQAARFLVQRAKRKGVPMNLSFEDMSALFSSPCFYCGRPPSNVARRESTYGVFLYSGIDRINSKAGYSADNARPCCWICNNMKGALTEADFFAHVKLLCTHMRL